MVRIGVVRELVRYPVKSMAGTPTRAAHLGWHGFAGDRRSAFRRVGDRSDFPWLSASRLPELLLYRPLLEDEGTGERLPTHVRTPSGQDLELHGEALRREIADRLRSDVELVSFRNGIFDDAVVSLISLTTVAALTDEAGVGMDARRFRPNILLETENAEPFREANWVGRTLVFGEADSTAAAVAVTAGDVRCMIVNLDPDTARQDGRVLRTVVRRNGNIAGVYGAAVRTGTIHVGQEVWLKAEEPLFSDSRSRAARPPGTAPASAPHERTRPARLRASPPL